MLKVKRSPAKVCWHVTYNGILLGTRDTKSEANALRDQLLRSQASCIMKA